MNTEPMTTAVLGKSVIAVPPVARNADLKWNHVANLKIIRHLEEGGVTTLLYGGNAALAHVAVSEYADLLTFLANSAAADSIVIPSVGPGYGMMMDQARILSDFPFPTAMLLPSRDGTTAAGMAGGVKRFVDRTRRPIVLYLKHDGMIDAATIKRMVGDGLISWIKYGIVRENPSQDPYLSSIVDAVGSSIVVSGMGEQPVIVHVRDFKLAGFTSGCVCIAPRLSTRMLKAVQAGDFTAAEQIRQQFSPLEKLRDAINPVRALHAAVALAGIGETGPITPFWSPINDGDAESIQAAAKQLLELNRN